MQQRDRAPWVDWKDIPPSARWLDEVLRAIEDAQAFVFVLTPTSLASETCAVELSHAVNNHKRLVVPVPVALGSVQVPDALGAVQWIAFDGSRSFDESVELVMTAIDVDLAHVRSHTRLLRLALDWSQRGEQHEALLRGGSCRRRKHGSRPRRLTSRRPATRIGGTSPRAAATRTSPT